MTDGAATVVTADEVRALLADPGLRWWLVHATDEVSFADGHLPGALARPADGLLQQLGDGVPIIVYGEDEHARAAPALVERLAALGIEVAWFAGGLGAWAAAGLPIERSG